MTDNTEAPLLPEPLTGAQVRRLYDNSPGLHEDARSFAGFVRIVRLVESAYRIGDSVVPNPEPGASSQWQPIGTAPLGPVILLGYAPHPRMEGSRRVYEGKWNYEQQTWTSVNGFLVHTAATHWMPLPPPPGATLEPGARDVLAERRRQVEQVAQQWDGCMWEGPGGDIDIGEAIRDAGRRLSGDSVVPATQPPGATLWPVLPPMNPRTGKPWRLTDPEVAPRIAALQASLQDPAKALAYLVAHGYVMPDGRTPPEYGGATTEGGQ